MLEDIVHSSHSLFTRLLSPLMVISNIYLYIKGQSPTYRNGIRSIPIMIIVPLLINYRSLDILTHTEVNRQQYVPLFIAEADVSYLGVFIAALGRARMDQGGKCGGKQFH